MNGSYLVVLSATVTFEKATRIRKRHEQFVHVLLKVTAKIIKTYIIKRETDYGEIS